MVVDDCVVPALGLLTAEYIREKKAPDVYFRNVSRFLQDVTSDEFDGLAELMRKAAAFRHEPSTVRIIVSESSRREPSTGEMGPDHGRGTPGLYIYPEHAPELEQHVTDSLPDPVSLLHRLAINGLASEVVMATAGSSIVGGDVRIEKQLAARLLLLLSPVET